MPSSLIGPIAFGGYVLGAVLFLFLGQGFSFLIFLIIALGLSFLALIFRNGAKFYLLIALFLFFVFGGGFRSAEKSAELVFDSVNHQKTAIEAEIVSLIVEKEKVFTFDVQVVAGQLTGKVFRVTVAKEIEKLFWGDQVLLIGQIETSRPVNKKADFVSPIPYEKYLWSQNLSGAIFFPKISVVKRGTEDSFYKTIFSWRERVLDRLKMFVAEPEASLAGGVLLGDRGMPQKLIEDFRASGLAHIVVLSGYNLAIIAYVVGLIFVRFPLLLKMLAIAFFTGLMVLASGGEVPVLRAYLFSLLILGSLFLGRPQTSLYLLLLTAFVFAIFNAFILFFDPSFALSFLATLGIILLTERLESFFPQVPQRLGLRKILSTTLAAEIAVLPYLSFFAGQISLVGLPANLLVLPIVPTLMLFSFLVIFVPFKILALPLAYLTSLLSKIIIFLASFFAGLPVAVLKTNFSLGHLFFSYFLLGLFLYFLFSFQNRKIRPNR